MAVTVGMIPLPPTELDSADSSAVRRGFGIVLPNLYNA